MLTDAQKKMLSEPLCRDFIRKLPGGGADYVDGWYVITRLNEVFGQDGWSDEYGALSVRDGARPLFSVTCTLTAGGCVRRNVGVGLAANDKPDAVETALKAAYTDALKRCAYKLGDSFGLALYEKVTGNQQRRGVGMASTTLAMREEIAGLATRAAINEWLKTNAAYVAKLPADEQDVLRGDVAERRLDLAAAPAPAAPQSPAAPPAPANDAPVANPAASEALTTARHRLVVARTIQTITAVVRAAPVQAIERAALWDATLSAADRVGSTEAALRESLARAEVLGATVAQWGVVATVLVALDSCTSAAGIEAVRKQYVAAVVALPEPLLMGVKGATALRARELGAPTVATKLADLAAEAKNPADLRAIYSRFEAAANAGQINEAENIAVTAALNARAEALAATVAA